MIEHYTTDPDVQMRDANDISPTIEQVVAAACLWAETGTIDNTDPATLAFVAMDAMSFGTSARAIWLHVANGRVCALYGNDDSAWHGAARVQLLGPYGVLPWSILPSSAKASARLWCEAPPTLSEVRVIATIRGATTHDAAVTVVRIGVRVADGSYRVATVKLAADRVEGYPSDAVAWLPPWSVTAAEREAR